MHGSHERIFSSMGTHPAINQLEGASLLAGMWWAVNEKELFVLQPVEELIDDIRERLNRVVPCEPVRVEFDVLD